MAPSLPVSQISLEDVQGIEGIEALLTPLNRALGAAHFALSRNLTFRENFRSMVKTLDVTVTSPWRTVSTFLNGWSAFTTGTFGNVQYRKNDAGEVELMGMVTGGTIGLTAFTLPTGYCPPFTAPYATTSNSAFGEVSITAAGLVVPTVGNNAWVSCYPVHYLTSDVSPGVNLASPLFFKSELRGKCTSLEVMSFVSKTSPGTPQPLPRLAWEDSGTGQLKLTNLLGVSPGNYSLTLLALAD